MKRRPSAALFKIFGDPMRLIIFERLGRVPQSAGELTRELPVTRSAVVQHLMVLKRVGLVDTVDEGRRRVYRTAPGALAPLRAWLDLQQRPRG